MGGMEVEPDLEQWRGKLRRLCKHQHLSGHIQVSGQILEQYQAKGKTRDKPLEVFIKTGNDKDPDVNFSFCNN